MENIPNPNDTQNISRSHELLDALRVRKNG